MYLSIFDIIWIDCRSTTITCVLKILLHLAYVAPLPCKTLTPYFIIEQKELKSH